MTAALIDTESVEEIYCISTEYESSSALGDLPDYLTENFSSISRLKRHEMTPGLSTYLLDEFGIDPYGTGTEAHVVERNDERYVHLMDDLKQVFLCLDSGFEEIDPFLNGE